MAPPRPRPGDGGDSDGPGSPSRPRGGDATPTVAAAQDATARAAQNGRPASAEGPGGTPQLALGAGSPTTRTLDEIRRIRDWRTRWQAGEQYVQELWGGGSQRHYPVDTNTDPDFPVTRPGGRDVDVPVTMPDGTTVAVEVKMYQQYRMVEVAPGQHAPHRVEVPLSDGIREQINKDVALRNEDPSYDPRWSFLGAGPSPALRDYLTRAGIIFLEYG